MANCSFQSITAPLKKLEIEAQLIILTSLRCKSNNEAADAVSYFFKFNTGINAFFCV